MKIKLLGLADGEHVFEDDIDPAGLGIDAEEISPPIHASARIDKRGGNYYIKVSASFTGALICDRCLEKFDRVLTGEVMLVYTENEELLAQGEDEDLRLVPKSGDAVDLSTDVRDAVLLTVPVKHVCREDCQGLCPDCGANRNTAPCSCSAERTDPRWDALKRLGR